MIKGRGTNSLRNFRTAAIYHAPRWLPVMVCLLAASTAVADSVRDDIGLFSDVTIRGIENGVLVFEFENGRTLSRPLTRVRSVTLAAGALVGSDELSRGDALLQRKRYEQALPMYQRVHELTKQQWTRDYATYRMIQANNALGRFNDAILHCLELTESQPELLSPLPITNLPEPDSADAQAALKEINARLAQKNNEPRRVALEQLRDALLRKTGATATQPAAHGDVDAPRSTEPTSASGTPRPPRNVNNTDNSSDAASNGTLPRGRRASAAIYQSLSVGRTAEALVAVEKALSGEMQDSQRDVWWLAEAEVRLALDQPDRAALAALKVIGLTPDSPYYAEALFTAGRAYEKIRVSRARQFYEDCMRHTTADIALRREAAARLEALPQNAGESAP